MLHGPAKKRYVVDLYERQVRKSWTITGWLCSFILIDILGLCFPWYTLPYGAVIGTAGVLFVEGFSVVENLRKKKSHAAEVADMAARIVECLTPEEAQKLIKKIKEDKK